MHDCDTHSGRNGLLSRGLHNSAARKTSGYHETSGTSFLVIPTNNTLASNSIATATLTGLLLLLLRSPLHETSPLCCVHAVPLLLLLPSPPSPPSHPHRSPLLLHWGAQSSYAAPLQGLSWSPSAAEEGEEGEKEWAGLRHSTSWLLFCASFHHQRHEVWGLWKMMLSINLRLYTETSSDPILENVL